MIILPYTIQSSIAKRKAGAIAGTDYVNQLNDVVQANRPTPHAGSDNDNAGGQFAVIVKVGAPVSSQLGRFAAKEFYLGDARSTLSGALAEADVGTFPSGEECVALELDALVMARLGFRLGTDQNGKTIVALAPRGTMPVTLRKTSGSDGNATTAPTWVYAADDLAGNEIATGLSPEGNRPKGKTHFATRGDLVFVSGAWKLHSCDEKPNFAEC